MFNWFKDRLRNNRPWFRADIGASKLEGRKLHDGSLELSSFFMGEQVSVHLPRETAEKLAQWMLRTYPNRTSNVIPLRKPHLVSKD